MAVPFAYACEISDRRFPCVRAVCSRVDLHWNFGDSRDGDDVVRGGSGLLLGSISVRYTPPNFIFLSF